MDIEARGPDGQQYRVEVGPEDTVRDVRRKLERVAGVGVRRMKLGDAYLREGQECSDVGLVADCVVNFEIGLNVENMRVVARVRPLLEREALTFKGAVHIDPAAAEVSVNADSKWTFDAVYDEHFTQTQIFTAEVMPLVQTVLDGHNATVLAYGQTGSGKTYTVTGSSERADGMIPQTVNALLDEIRILEGPRRSFSLKVSYVELYNSQPRDLLSEQGGPWKVRNIPPGGFSIPGLQEREVKCMEDCMKLLHEGSMRRTERTSNSHTIFCCTVTSTDLEADADSPVVVQSKLNLCDLAGSERRSKVNLTGLTMREVTDVGMTLNALGKVLGSLLTGNKHVPYRNSPLTMLLKDSLGGTSTSVLFANVAPTEKDVDETISTLRFANWLRRACQTGGCQT